MNLARLLRRAWFLLVVGYTTITSNTQGAGNLVPAATGPAAARFRVFALRPPRGISFLPAPAASPQELEFYPTARSPEYTWAGPGPLRFVDSASGIVVAEVELPVAGGSRMLLVFVPRSEGRAGRRFEVLALDDTAPAHSGGQFGILNLTGLRLHGTLSGQPIQVGPGLQTVGSRRGTGRLELRTTHGGRDFRAYGDQLTFRDGESALLVLFPPYYAGSLEVQGRLLLDEPPISEIPRDVRRPTR